MKVTIQPATKTDLPMMRNLLQELMDAVEDTVGFDIEQPVKNYENFIEGSGNYMLVARDEDRVLGFVSFTTRKTIMHTLPSGLIDEIVVTRDSRGSGIGKLLILAVIDKCRELGCCEVEVSTEKTNTKAREFYKSCGFNDDAVLLEMDLN
ncbi:MAG: GNAT family N-acetyltransferase [Promethearchaeota archaeon]